MGSLGNYFIWLIILYAYCVALLILTKLELNFVYSKLFHYFTFIGLVLLVGITLSQSGAASTPFYGAALAMAFFIGTSIVVPALLLIPYLAFLIGHYFEVFWYGTFTGISGMKTDKTYDKAEAEEKKRNYDKAMEIYKQYITEDPNDLEAKRRMAEIFYIKGQYDVAVKEFKEIIPLIKDTEIKVMLIFRVSDILVEKPNRVEEAKILLKRVEHEFEGTKFSRFATNRLKRLE